ncbi:MAG TPA: hypothetical protein VL854_12185 [Nitrososphaeraceae archaeon]|jgi:uncharacterized membrane protein YgcG|nr:hypothetical protein [Nitrososphaeraceae archaeon]
MTYNTKFQNRAISMMVLTLISIIVLSTLTIGNVDARNMGTNSCTPNNDGTIGTTTCCAPDLDTAEVWCTTCANTNPPSNCSEAELQFHTKGGVLSNDDSSNQGGSNTVDPDKIIEGGTFNDGSGSDNSGGSSGGIDSSKINSGAVFNQ